jgi:tetratricopeptide (TPR) repeat protein
LQAYTRAIRVNPQMVPAHYNLAMIFLKQGNRKLALQQYAILKGLDAQAAERLFLKIYPETIDKIRAPEFSE